MNDRWLWLWTLSPVGLGILILLVLAEFRVIEFHFSIHNLPTLLLFVGLLVSIGATSMLISRAGLRRIQRDSDRHAQQIFAEERSRFLQRLDHEIKNPLMGIQTAVDNLAETTDIAQRHYINAAIQEQIRRLTRIVNDLRKIGELDRREIDHTSVNLDMLLEEVAHIGIEEAQAIHRHMTAKIPPMLPHIGGDYDLLFLSVYNVVNNAVKYTAPGDNIVLCVNMDQTHVTIEVRDNGPGIPPEDLPHIWDELYRSAEVKDTPGSGIGLALVRRSIERHGGQVAITSEVGVGTCVQLKLPVGLDQSA